MTRVYLAVLFLLFCLSQRGLSQSGIFVTPDRDQTVPFASDENVTYTCTVDGGRTAVWEVRGRQILGLEQARVFAENGIFVEGLDSNTSLISISGEARRNASQNDPPGVYLHCVALEKLKGTSGREYMIITYDPPISPIDLTLELSSTPNPTLSLIWDRPFNVDPRVSIVYTVEINSTLPGGTNYGPFMNVVQTSYLIDFPEALHSNKSCQMYTFFVTAINGAGRSVPAQYVDTLPITTDVTNISQTLRVGSVDLRNGQGIAFSLSFKTLRSCSENFPIQNYTIMVDNITTQYTLTLSSSSSLPGPGEMALLQLNNTVFTELVLDARYSLSVVACSNFSCKQSTSVTLNTTDLQRAEVVFFENNIFLLCLLADNSPALGCSIRLRLRNTNDSQSDDVFELRRPTSGAGSDDVIISNCNMSTNRYLAYREIVGVDLEGDRSLGEVWLRVNETEAGSLDEFTRLTNCTLPQPPPGTGGDNLGLAIALPVVFGLILTVVVTVIVILLVVFFKQRRKIKSQPTIETEHNDEDDSFVCEVKFKGDEFAQLLKPAVKRSTSAPVSFINNTRTPSSSESSSQADNVDRSTPVRGNKPPVPYLRSVSDNYQMNAYELELGKRSLRLRFHRPGLRQYGKRTLSDGGSGIGSAGEGGEGGVATGGGEYIPNVSSRLKLSDELKSLLCEDNLHIVHEESEPTSPASDSPDGERHSLIVPEGNALNSNSSKKKTSTSPNLSDRSGITFSTGNDKVTGL